MKKEKAQRGVPLAIKAEEALQRAVANAIRDRRDKGRSIAIWRDGKVVHIPADQIVVREVKAKYTAS